MKFKEFWQKYKKEVAKMLVTHVALAVFSIMCTSPLLLLGDEDPTAYNTIIIIASVFVFAFYYYLIRTQLWTRGAKDKISADGGRMKLSPMTGIYIGLLSSLPSFILNILYIITYYYQDYAAFRGIHGVTAMLELLWDAPAIGIYYVSGTPFSYLASSVLPVLFAGLAYFLGTKEFSLFGGAKRS